MDLKSQRYSFQSLKHCHKPRKQFYDTLNNFEKIFKNHDSGYIFPSRNPTRFGVNHAI